MKTESELLLCSLHLAPDEFEILNEATLMAGDISTEQLVNQAVSEWINKRREVTHMDITGLCLKREVDDMVVSIEVGGKWINVIREPAEGPISHIVEPAGMEKSVKEAENKASDDRHFQSLVRN